MSRLVTQSAVAARFLRYVAINTQSDESSTSTPSTDRQLTLAGVLADELRALGVTDIRVDPRCYVYGVLPASPGLEGKPAIGFIAHMDTAPDASGEGVNPQIHPDYDGGEVILGAGLSLRPAEFPHLASLAGRTLITTDGKTLLGADDKAGIAEIMTMCERLQKEKIPHGKICVAFTPDEEVGRGVDHFDVAGFGADFAYTADGDAEGEIAYENFNAASAAVTVRGKSIHPGSAKNAMINASLAAMEFDSLLPKNERPCDTEGYEGFYHLSEMTGTVSEATLCYILRDHDAASFEKRKNTLLEIAGQMNLRFGEERVTVELHDQYRNMAEQIASCMHLIENAKAAAIAAGVVPVVSPIRGGTDGARLSFMGLPCPNLGTGGYCYHGPFEHITVEGMEKATAMLTEIVKQYAV